MHARMRMILEEINVLESNIKILKNKSIKDSRKASELLNIFFKVKNCLKISTNKKKIDGIILNLPLLYVQINKV